MPTMKANRNHIYRETVGGIWKEGREGRGGGGGAEGRKHERKGAGNKERQEGRYGKNDIKRKRARLPRRRLSIHPSGRGNTSPTATKRHHLLAVASTRCIRLLYLIN